MRLLKPLSIGLILSIIMTLAIAMVQADAACMLDDGRVNARPHRDCGAPVAIFMTKNEIVVLAYEEAIDNKPEQFIIRAPRNNEIPTGNHALLGQATNPVNGKAVILSRLTTGEYQLNTFRDNGEAYIVVWYQGAQDVYHLDPVTGAPLDGAQPLIVPGGSTSPAAAPAASAAGEAPATGEGEGTETGEADTTPAPAVVGNAPENAISLDSCRITTTRIVRLRTEPNTSSDIITRLPYRTSWQATARTADWFRIVYEDTQGWLSAAYTSTSGGCG